MSNPAKTLIIVEGAKAEPEFCHSIETAYSIDFSIYCLKTNIYTLYKKLKEYDFNADIKDVLKELHPEYSEMLSQKFAYTYLFFDLDPHHSKKDETRPIKQIIEENIEKVKEMAGYFTDETNPSVGRLYINYPMLESYRDCDTTFDQNYKNEYVDLEKIVSFKQYVSKKKMSAKHLDKYTSDDFNQLTKMNTYKLNAIFSKEWSGPEYSTYKSISTAYNILRRQSEIIYEENRIAVLNTSLFFLLDYYGNKEGFYDHIVLSVTNK